MKKTVVEWLYNNLKSHFEHDGDLLEVVQMSFKQAKEMEKKQIEDAYMDGWMSCEKWFADKELDEHIVDTNEMILDKVLFEQATVAMEEHYGYDCETEIDAYFRGAKWMQKQFKQQEQ